MLQRIVFFLQKKNEKENLKELLRQLAQKEVAAEIIVLQEASDEWQESFTPKDKASENTLYITDNSACYKRLRESNLPTIVYLYEENRGENFAQAEYAIEQIAEIEYESLLLAYQRLTGQPWMIITTNRCKVRESTTDDMDAFYRIYKEPSITYYMENLYENRDEEKAYLEDYIKRVYGFYGYGMWTVLDKESGEVIGRAGISWREGYDIPELGFVIALPYQGKGYAYEVCQAILEYGCKELGFQTYQVIIMEGNTASEALCKKLGFTECEKLEMEGKVYTRLLLKIK